MLRKCLNEICLPLLTVGSCESVFAVEAGRVRGRLSLRLRNVVFCSQGGNTVLSARVTIHVASCDVGMPEPAQVDAALAYMLLVSLL